MTNLPEFPTDRPDACPFCGQELGLDNEAQEVEAGVAYSCTACQSIVYFVPKDPSTVDLGRRFASEEDGSTAKVAQGWGHALSEEEFMSDAIEKGLIPGGLKAYYRIMELWDIGEEEASVLLGYDHRPDVTEIGIDPLKRISHTLGIYRALHTLLSHESANAWVKQPNTAELFKGRPALELLQKGTQGFEQVRSYLATNLA
jgi:hypothetical protein